MNPGTAGWVSTLVGIMPVLLGVASLGTILLQFGYSKAVIDRLAQDRKDDRKDLQDWREEVDADREEFGKFISRYQGREEGRRRERP